MKLNKIILTALLLNSFICASNSSNSFGSVGVNMTPTARFFEEGSVAFSLARHDSFSRSDLIAQPYDWLEVSIFYADIPGREYPASFGAQSYKDKGFNTKFLVRKETNSFPQIAIGLSDFAGTGLFSSEYIVGSKTFNKFDFSLGIGWGLYSDGYSFKNPFRFLSDRFTDRNLDYGSTQGKFDGKDLFSGKKASLFGSVKYRSKNGNFFIETNPTSFTGRLETVEQASKIFVGFESNFLESFYVKIFAGNKEDFNINFSTNFNFSEVKSKPFIKPTRFFGKPTIDLIDSLQNNGISLSDISIDEKDRLYIGVRQNSYFNKRDSNEIVLKSIQHAQINNFDEVIVAQYLFGEEITTDNYDLTLNQKIAGPIKTIKTRNIYNLDESLPNTKFAINPSLRTMLAAREGFLYYGLMVEANIETYFSEKINMISKITYSVSDNFDELYIGPVTTFPAQVRTDIKDYLKKLGDKPSIERFEINYSDKFNNHYLMAKAGILESMFMGYGFEYLNHDQSNNYALGFELFDVKKRDYDYDFSTLDYEVITGHINFYHYFDPLKLTTHLSWGQYLAGDEGLTFDFSRRFNNGTRFGAYFSLTDVSFEEFGEGSFDKGIYIEVPITSFSGNMSGFQWTPLTKDPAQKLKLSSKIFDNIRRYIY